MTTSRVSRASTATDARIRWINCLLAALPLFIAGCPTLPPAERESLQRASQEYESGRYAEALTRLDKLIRDYDQAAEIDEAYYLRGLCRVRLGKTAEAKRDFQRAAQGRGREELRAKAKVSLATLAYQQRDWAEAAQFYAEAIEDLPNEPPTGEILYSAGLSLQRAGRWPEARRAFSRIVHHFGSSQVAEQARRKATWTHEYFSIQLGAHAYVEKALQSVSAFKQRGLNATQENHPRQGKAMWIVMTGRYRTYAEAEAALRRVKSFQSDAFIIP